MNSQLHILLVDDNPEDRALVIRELHRDFPSIEIHQVIDAKQFARTLESGSGDIVITDYQLRWSDGLAVLRAIKASWPECPVIMFTGTGSEEVAVEAMKAGLDDYVLKAVAHYALLPGAVKRALQRKTQLRALKEAESQYETLFNNLPIGLFKTTPAGKILDANPAAVQMLGYPDRASLLNVNAADLFAETADSTRWQQLTGGDTVVRGFQTQLRRRDGSFISVEENIRAVRDADGRILYFEGSVEDITERLNLEAQLRHSQKMESVGQLAAGVAHDFNNVLTIIKGHADLLLAKDNLPADYSGSLERISSASDRAANLTRQLLTFSRRQVMQPKVLDLNEVIRNVARMLERTLGENIAVRLEPASDLPPIYADAGMLEQTLMNLAVNARDAMPRGGELFIGSMSTEVTPSCAQLNSEARVGRFVCLTVADTGAGMDPEVLSRIFEPFFTTKEVGKGTGLGLATVYGITKLHRGWIEVTSEVNKGSAFKVFLPATSKPKPTESPSAGPVERKIRGGNEALLLVEDEPELRVLARQILECYGYRVFEAATGPEALKLWPQHAQEIDLLLTDLVMPDGISGWELAGKLRADRPDLKVICASGYSIDLLNKQFDSSNGFRFLPKPFKPQMLALAVRECLDS
jgi:PAS domain S-box-containing protein